MPIAGTSVVAGPQGADVGDMLRSVAAGAVKGAEAIEDKRRFEETLTEKKREFDADLQFRYDHLEHLAREGKLTREQNEKLLKIRESGQYGRQARDISLQDRDRLDRLGHDANQRQADRTLSKDIAVMRDATTRRGQDVGASVAFRGQDVTLQGQRIAAETARRGQDVSLRTATMGAQLEATREANKQRMLDLNETLQTVTGGNPKRFSSLPTAMQEQAALGLARQRVGSDVLWNQLAPEERARQVLGAKTELRGGAGRLEAFYQNQERVARIEAGARGAAGGMGDWSRDMMQELIDDPSPAYDVSKLTRPLLPLERTSWSPDGLFDTFDIDELARVAPTAVPMIDELGEIIEQAGVESFEMIRNNAPTNDFQASYKRALREGVEKIDDEMVAPREIKLEVMRKYAQAITHHYEAGTQLGPSGKDFKPSWQAEMAARELVYKGDVGE